MWNFFAGEANVVIHAPSSVQQGEPAMLECRTGHERSAIKRLTWGERKTPGVLYFYRNKRPPADLQLYLRGRGVVWWSDSTNISNIMYINSTRLTDSGNYTCDVKILRGPTENVKKPLVVYGECSIR